MWPENEENLAERMRAVAERAQHYGRVLDYGLRVHMIVRDTEAEAREYAQELVSRLDDARGDEIRSRSLDAKSLGVSFSPSSASVPMMQASANPICGPGSGVPVPVAGGAGRQCRSGAEQD
ncbi:MAG: LLM class flavin-dependent oxidoreductase [Thiolinea sp.]